MEHKEEIVATRVGGLGSSDAKMVARIGRNGCISDSDKKRIAIMLGLEEHSNFTNEAMEYGNYIEDKIFLNRKLRWFEAVSNPLYKDAYLSSKLGFDVINHIDIEYINKNHSKLVWCEVKATKLSFEDTLKEYKEQLDWHYMLGNVKAMELKLDFELKLIHYQVGEEYGEFDSANITTQNVDCALNAEILEGLTIISKEIKNFEYTAKEEFRLSDLPAKWQQEAQLIQQELVRIKEAEEKVESFKERLAQIMKANNVKSIKNEFFNITYVDDSVSTSFDSKKLKEDDIDTYNKYLKTTTRKGFVKLTIKN